MSRFQDMNLQLAWPNNPLATGDSVCYLVARKFCSCHPLLSEGIRQNNCCVQFHVQGLPAIMGKPSSVRAGGFPLQSPIEVIF